MACDNFDCIIEEKKKIAHPIDNLSLYEKKLYDAQTANRRCYEKNPINIIEGFSYSVTWANAIKVLVIVLLVILFVSLLMDVIYPKEVVKVGVKPLTTESASSPSVSSTSK